MLEGLWHARLGDDWGRESVFSFLFLSCYSTWLRDIESMSKCYGKRNCVACMK